ncbi:MAG: hypothetical protein KC978_10445 [Candidatus Omnitrophica bacterium]|nr:hypothetical protein [Candidatus Omnitrophota bacterium]
MAQADQQRLANFYDFDKYFWKLSRVTKSSVANEFPVWTHVFADFHAHQLIMPIGMVLVSLLVAYSIRQSGYWRLKGLGALPEARNLYGGSITSAFQILFISLLLGMVFITNGWDYPALLGLTLFTFLMVFIYSGGDWWRANRFGFGRYLVRMNIWGRGIKRLTIGKFGFIQNVVLLPIIVISLSYFLFYPFHRYFHPPKRVAGIGWMHQAASGWTTPYEFLQIFGIPLLILIPILITWLWRWGTASKWGGLKVFLTLILSLAASIGLVKYFSGLTLKSFDPASLESPPSIRDSLIYWQWVDSEIAYLVFGVALFIGLLLLPGIFARRSRYETRWACLLLAVGFAIIAGCEVVYINEGWSAPLHRWNTVFKFHLQAWHFIGLGIGCFLGLWFQRNPETPGVVARSAGRFFRYAIGYPILLFSLYLAVLFPLILPYFTGYGGGFSFRSRQIEADFTLDGLNFLRHKHPDYAAVVDFLRAETEGQPTIVEVNGESYHHDRGWIATHTGLPTLIGWPHHVRERDHPPEPRIELVKTIYNSTNRERVRDILRDNKVRFVILGPTERKFFTSIQGLRKFDEWNDLFYPVFRSNIEEPGVTLYGVHPAYQLSEDWTPPGGSEAAFTFFEKESGRPLLRGAAGFGGGEYREPRGLVVSSSGEVLIADSMNNRVQAFDPKGNLKWILGEQGEQIGEFKEPRDLAVDDEGQVYVLDTWNARVQVFSPTGDIVMDYPVPGGSNGIAVGSVPLAVFDRESKDLEIPDAPLLGATMTFIANTAGRNIVVVNKNGEQTQTWGAGKLVEPVDVEITSKGLAVADARAKKVSWYDGRGRFLNEWDIPTETTGDQTNELKLAWDEKRKLLLVTDPTHDKLFVYSEKGDIILDTTVEGGPSGVGVTRDGRVFIAAKREGKILLVPVPTKR